MSMILPREFSLTMATAANNTFFQEMKFENKF